MFSTNLFINKENKKKKSKERIESFIFLFVFSLTLLFFSNYRLIVDINKSNDIIYFLLLALSIINFLIIIFMNSSIEKIKKIYDFIFRKIGLIILSLILIIIYIIWFIPASLINKINSRKNLETTFVDYSDLIIKQNKKNIFSQLKNIFSYFICSGNWYFIPLLIILILIGLILFFAQSPLISPLIYPLI